MHLTLRMFGLDVLDLDITTDTDAPQRESDIGIAAQVHVDPPGERMGFEDRSRR